MHSNHIRQAGTIMIDIEDITKPESRTPRMKALEVRFDSLVAKQRQNMIKNEFDLVIHHLRVPETV